MHRRSTVSKKRPAPLAPVPSVAPFMDLVAADEKELTNLLGDARLARRLIKLQARMPQASLPELIAYDWLEKYQIQFLYQGEYGGGRQVRGGQVPDFVINWGGKGLVWRVQGDYWHTKPGARENDIVGKMQLMGSWVNGLQVRNIVDVWESQLYKRYDFVLTMAMAGIEVGK